MENRKRKLNFTIAVQQDVQQLFQSYSDEDLCQLDCDAFQSFISFKCNEVKEIQKNKLHQIELEVEQKRQDLLVKYFGNQCICILCKKAFMKQDLKSSPSCAVPHYVCNACWDLSETDCMDDPNVTMYSCPLCKSKHFVNSTYLDFYHIGIWVSILNGQFHGCNGKVIEFDNALGTLILQSDKKLHTSVVNVELLLPKELDFVKVLHGPFEGLFGKVKFIQKDVCFVEVDLNSIECKISNVAVMIQNKQELKWTGLE